MEKSEDILLDGEKVCLPRAVTEEDMDDLLLLDDDIPTRDLSGVFENTQEIDWSKDE